MMQNHGLQSNDTPVCGKNSASISKAVMSAGSVPRSQCPGIHQVELAQLAIMTSSSLYHSLIDFFPSQRFAQEHVSTCVL